MVHQTKQLKQKHHTTKQEQIIQKHLTSIFTYFLIFYYEARQTAKWPAMQVATMLADHKQIDKRTTLRNQNKSAALGRPAMKLLGGGGGQLVCGRPTLALSSALVPQTLSCLVCVELICALS